MATGTVPETQVAKQQPSKLSTLKGWLEGDDFKAAIAKALPKHMTAERFIRMAITASMKVPKLMECTQASIFNCLLTLSQYGLEPDGRRAHLIPFKNRSKDDRGNWSEVLECTLIVDFKGYAELVMRSGLVSNIHADVVCENDEFEYNMGRILKHRIDFRKPRGPAYAAYTVVRMKDGSEKCEVMPKDDIYAIRNRGQGWIAFQKGWAKQSPWNPAEPVIEYEMWKKSTFRRLTKWLTLSPEIISLMEREDHEDERLRNAIPTEGFTIGEGRSKSDALAEMLANQAASGEEDQRGLPEPESNDILDQMREARESPAKEPELVPAASGKKKATASTAKADQPSLLATGIYSSIASAKRREELDRVDDDIRDARSRDEITHDESVELRKALKDKLATFAE